MNGSVPLDGATGERLRPDGARRPEAHAATIAVAVAAAFLAVKGAADSVHFDFTAFYCAGRAERFGLDPYLGGSLAACERGIRHTGVILPAPLPPYALAPIALLARLDFTRAAAVWQIVTIALCIGTVAALSRLARIPLALAAAPFLLPLLFSSLLSGQVVPLLLFGIVAATACAKAGRAWWAACGAALTMVEPHIGIVACAGLAIAMPRARLPLALAASAIAAVSLAGPGLPGTVEYLRDVLPAHARSEIAHQGQFSLTYVLHELGAPDAAALAGGAASYALACVLGIATGLVLGRRMANIGYAVAVPAAFALIGGTFIHLPQMVAALPAAFMLADDLRERTPAASVAVRSAIVVLSVPWADPTILTDLPWLCALVAGGLGFWAWRGAIAAAAVAVAAYASIVAAGARVATTLRGDPTAFVAHATRGALAEIAWQEWVYIRFTFDPTLYLLLKLPTWLALAAIAYAACALAWSLRGARAGGLRAA